MRLTPRLGLCMLAALIGCAAPPTPATPTPEPPEAQRDDTPARTGPGSAAEHGCPALSADPPAPSGEPGARRLALIVGVGDYQAEGIPDLEGPPRDAQRIYELLTGPYGFPADNICVLLDAEATHAHFEAAWTRALVERAAPGDEAVFFFAGHGSQGRDWDRNGVDEPDGWDETLMLHDSRVGDQLDLIDDQLNGLLASLHARTPAVTVLIDACNSGSAARGLQDGRAEGVHVRQFIPLDIPPPEGYSPSQAGDYSPAALPGLVFVSAARDGTSALEIDGEGVFTRALVEALQQADAALTWDQLTRSLPRLVAASGSPQVLTFEGALERGVLGGPFRARPPGWDVAEVSEGRLRLSGLPLPGWTEGAVLAIYPGGVRAEDLADPARAAAARRGRVELSQADAFGGQARVLEGSGFSDQDVAVLERPGAAPPRLRLRLQERGRHALPEAVAQGITEGLAASPELAGAVAIDPKGPWSLRAGPEGSLQLLGPEGSLRNTLGAGEDDPVAAALHLLWLFNRQAALLELTAEPGHGAWVEVQLEAIPASKQVFCPKRPFELAAPGALQEVPVCTGAQLRVTLSEQAPGPRVVGGVRLDNDGAIEGLLAEGQRIELKPGEQALLPGVTLFHPPVDAVDTVLVFATEDRVAWDQLEGSAARGVALSEDERRLRGALHEPGYEDLPAPSTWAVTALPIQVTAERSLWSPEAREDPGLCDARRVRTVSDCPSD
ncbi:MAG: caspase family protein [Alphaproteobacteria bacterium]|nr:caspase family protein [Alphaproteobacteria bacterium]MCB9792747.1 caspase family protein [Alphaproteobacteria bacterium]